jgi:hypothetical protein
MIVAMKTQSHDVPPQTNLEPFVSVEEASRFLSIEPDYLLNLARRGMPGAYALDPDRIRKTWIFRLSELAKSVTGRGNITSGSPR